MNVYTPDKWVVVKIEGKNVPLVYKVFACWYGGYLNGDSWKLNSGIKTVSSKRGYFEFEGCSGSIYKCGKKQYGTNMYGAGVLNGYIEKAKEQQVEIQIMDQNTDWKSLKYQ